MIKRYCRIFFSLALFFAGRLTFAQTDAASQQPVAADTAETNLTLDFPKLSYGIRGGVNFAQFNVNGGDLKTANSLRNDRANHVRIQAGLVSNYALNENLSLQAELLFSQKGIKYRGVTPVNKILQEYKNQTILNYLEVPVLVKVSSPVYGDSLRFFVNVGPSVSFLLNGSQRFKTKGIETNEDIIFSRTNATDTRPEFKRLDASVHAGAGFELLTGFGNIAVEGRAVFGLINIMDSFNANIVSPKVYNRSIGLYVTYFLPDLSR